ncbi:aldo/keto reductase [Flavisolibacter sp. BT320]|nr:aldo/keto reductase [Flavisolibacter longurius]
MDNTNKKTGTGLARRDLFKTGLVLAGGALLPTACSLPAGSQAGPHAKHPAKLSDKRKLGKLEVSSIGIGVQNMHRQYNTLVPNRPQMIKILQAAYDQGITFFDCAEAYGPHENERILGEAIQSFRDKVVITSKFGWNIDPLTGERRPGLNSKPAHIKPAVEGMLKRLRTDHIDLLYQHRVDPEVPIEDVAGAVKDLMDQGKVLHWGLSEPGLQTIRRAHATLPLTAIQNEYSMVYPGPEKEVIPLCEELGNGFVPWWPLGCQLLTGWIDANTRFPLGDIRAVTSRYAPENLPQNLKLVELIKTWAVRKGAAPAQIAIAWLMAQKPWIVPIPGTTNMAHMQENSSAHNVKFTASELAELNAAVQSIEIKGQRLPDAVLVFSGVEAPPKR